MSPPHTWVAAYCALIPGLCSNSLSWSPEYSSIKNRGSRAFGRPAFRAQCIQAVSYFFRWKLLQEDGSQSICFFCFGEPKLGQLVDLRYQIFFFSSISLLLRKPVNQLKHLTWGNTEVTFNSETNCLWIAKENSSAAWKGSGSKRRGQEGGF